MAEWTVDSLEWEEMSPRDVCSTIARLYIADRADNSDRAHSMFRAQVTNAALSVARIENERISLDLVAGRLASRLGTEPVATRFAPMPMAYSRLAGC
ncbi:MAG: hypothetical protein ACI8Y4_000906 [Candidatus Poriferisodalaceae bacterium]|jgi:hypothetical protein